MRRIYTISFCLCFGILLLGIPLSYSAVANHHYTRLDYGPKHHKQLNQINVYYTSYIVRFVYPAAMKEYAEEKTYFNIGYNPIDPKEALARLKKEMCMSPQIYLLLTSGYLRKNFVEDEPKGFSNVLTSLVSGFLQHEYYYKLIKARVLVNAKAEQEWGFIADWLEEERKLSHLYTSDAYFLMNIGSFQPYYGKIYSHQNNFLKQAVFLWLTKKHHWPVPTNKQIKEGDMNIDLWPLLTMKKRKIVAYKMKVIQLLQDEKGFFARLFRFHLLNAECLDRGQSSTALMKLRDSFFEGKPLQTKLLSWLSTLYWECLDVPSVLNSTGNLSLDIFFAPILAAFTFPGFLVMIWLSNFVLLSYLFYIVATLDEEITNRKSIRLRIAESWDSIKKRFISNKNDPINST